MLGKRDKTAVSPTRDTDDVAARLQSDDGDEAAPVVRPIPKRQSIDRSNPGEDDRDSTAPPRAVEQSKENEQTGHEVYKVVNTLMNRSRRGAKPNPWDSQGTESGKLSRLVSPSTWNEKKE